MICFCDMWLPVASLPHQRASTAERLNHGLERSAAEHSMNEENEENAEHEYEIRIDKINHSD